MILTYGFGICLVTSACRTSLEVLLQKILPSFGARPISIWEALILAEKGRISLQPNGLEWVNSALKTLETREASLNHRIAVISRQIDLPHQDPADRFIAATAVYYELKLATVDNNLTNVSWLETLS